MSLELNLVKPSLVNRRMRIMGGSIACLLGGIYFRCMADVFKHTGVWGGQAKLKALLFQSCFLLPCFLITWWTFRGSFSAVDITKPLLRLSFAIYAALSVCLALTIFSGIDLPDESVYLFQAKAIQLGHLTVDAPADFITSVPEWRKAFAFDHHVMYQGRWFGKYPPGWPILLSMGLRLGTPWLLTPLLGAGVLWLSYRIALESFDENTAAIAVFLMVASPYFVMNFVGFMSHPACAFFVTLATLLVLRATRKGRVGPELYWAIVAIFVSFWIRPFTTFCVGAVLAMATLWSFRKELSRLSGIALFGVLAMAVLLVSTLIYNRELTGKPWLTPYALSRGRDLPPELRLAPSSILRNIRDITSFSIGDTLFASVCFLFLLASYGLLKGKNKGFEMALFAGLFGSLVLGHLVQTETSTSYVGERYYIEGFFAASILGAVGLQKLQRSWCLSPRVAITMFTVLLAVQTSHYIILGKTVLLSRKAYVLVQTAIDSLCLKDAVVFLRNNNNEFKPQRYNANDAYWKSANLIYLRDPGTTERDGLTRALQRRLWIAASFDGYDKEVSIERSRLF